MKKTLLTASIAALFITGCQTPPVNSVTRADIDALRAEVSATRTAAQAAAQASQQASLTAQDAKSTALRTDEKLNRMFKKAQMK